MVRPLSPLGLWNALYDVILVDACRSFLTLQEICNRGFSNQLVFYFSIPTFLPVSLLFSTSLISKPCRQHYRLFQKQWAPQKNLCQTLPQKLCVVVLVAMLVIVLKLVVGHEDRAVEQQLALCFRRLWDQMLAASSDHRLRRDCHLFILRPFCRHKSFNHHQLLHISCDTCFRQNLIGVRWSKRGSSWAYSVYTSWKRSARLFPEQCKPSFGWSRAGFWLHPGYKKERLLRLLTSELRRSEFSEIKRSVKNVFSCQDSECRNSEKRHKSGVVFTGAYM